MIELNKYLMNLAERRPIFHSEADFQHELAWEIRLSLPQALIRLERPIGENQRGAIDIVISIGTHKYAIEIKYFVRKFDHFFNGEQFNLKQQGAADVRRYDFCKDIQRMESFRREPDCSASVLVITNEPGFWSGSKRNSTCDAAFQITDGRVLSGTLEWAAHTSAGSRKNRESAIHLQGSYPLFWQDYKDLKCPNGKFRYLQVDVT